MPLMFCSNKNHVKTLTQWNSTNLNLCLQAGKPVTVLVVGRTAGRFQRHASAAANAKSCCCRTEIFQAADVRLPFDMPWSSR
eukprot:s2311_g1.t1